MTEEQIQKRKEYQREYARQKRANRTPEQHEDAKAQKRMHRVLNIERLREEARQKYRLNSEKIKQSVASYTRKNREKKNIRERQYYAKNPKKVNERNQKYYWENLEKFAATNQRRRARKKSQIHPELDRQLEEAIHAQCIHLTHTTGEVHHVDHIIPIACGGFHHHDNLQCLPAKLNLQKHDNPVWEHHGYKCWRDVPTHLWPKQLDKLYSSLLV
jgi:molybdopterin synthase catalytic subunit